MTQHSDTDFLELCQNISKILNISPQEIREHSALFIKIDPYIKNCLYSLSRIEEDDLKTSAALSLEFLVKFKQSPFE